MFVRFKNSWEELDPGPMDNLEYGRVNDSTTGGRNSQNCQLSRSYKIFFTLPCIITSRKSVPPLYRFQVQTGFIPDS